MAAASISKGWKSISSLLLELISRVPETCTNSFRKLKEWEKLKGPKKAEAPYALFRAVFLDNTSHLAEKRRLPPEDFRFIEGWWHWIESLGKRINATDVPRMFPTKEIRNYHVASTHNTANGAVFASSQGMAGMGLRTIREGDRVFVVKGSSAPLILRPRFNEGSPGDLSTHKSQNGYLLVGRCYLEGVMGGEAVTPDSKWQHLRLW